MRNARKTGFAEADGGHLDHSGEGLPLALVRARECVMAHFRNLLRRYNLTEPQWRVLKTMEEIATVELSELSRRTALLMPSLSRIVRELELRGYMQQGRRSTRPQAHPGHADGPRPAAGGGDLAGM